MESIPQLQILLTEPLTPEGRRIIISALSSLQMQEPETEQTLKCLEVNKWWKRTYGTAAQFAVIKAHMNLLCDFLTAKLCEDYLGVAYHVPTRVDDLAGILQDEQMRGAGPSGDKLIRNPLQQLNIDVHHAEARLLQIKQRGSSANDLEHLRQSGHYERLDDFLNGDKHLLADLWKSESIEESVYEQLHSKIFSTEQDKRSSWFQWLTSR